MDVTRQSATPASEERIIEMTREYDAAWLRRDTSAVDAALSPGYVYVSSAGEPWPRRRTLELLRSPSYDLTSASRAEVEVHLYDSAAIVVGRWRGEGTYQGEAFRDDQRCTLVWSRHGEEWRVALEQCTNLAPAE
jgi:ketosteroid isomerase-like protein